jgi:hypothetical protein
MNKKTLITLIVLVFGVGIALWAIHAAGLGCNASCYTPVSQTAAPGK